MRLTLFRRRRIAPADLPPVSGASMPGPLHSGLTGDAFTAAAAIGSARLVAADATGPAQKKTEPCPVCGHPKGDHSVRVNRSLPGLSDRRDWCHDCDSECPGASSVVATEWPTREPRRIDPPLGGLAPLGMTPPLWKPGRYTVTYDRVGDHGRRGTAGLAPIQPLTATCLTVGDLAQQIVTDLAQLTGLVTTVMVDQAAGGGVILGEGGARLGTFAYERRGGVAR